MKAKEIRGMDKISLNEKILELNKELIKTNAQIATGAAIKNPGQVKEIKKTVARILTIQHEKATKAKKSEVDKKT